MTSKNKCNLYTNLKVGQEISIIHKDGMHFDNVTYEGHDCNRQQLYFSWKGEMQITPVDDIDIKKIITKKR